MVDVFVKNPITTFSVIPSKDGIHYFRLNRDSGFSRNDEACDFLQVHPDLYVNKNPHTPVFLHSLSGHSAHSAFWDMYKEHFWGQSG